MARLSGAKPWHKALPHEGAHYIARMASPSPVTDGDFVYASFGSHGLYRLDAIGGVVWSRDFGPMNVKHGHGEGSSPVLYGDALFIELVNRLRGSGIHEFFIVGRPGEK